MTPRELSGPERAALVILGLDEAVAAEILKQMDDESLRALARTVDAMNPIPMDALDEAYKAFARGMTEPILPGSGGTYVRRLAESALGKEKARKVFELPQPKPMPMDAIKRARTATLASLLNEEHPQVAAVIISQLPRNQAAQILKILSSEKRIDLIARISSLEEVSPRAVELASEALAQALAAAGGLDEGGESAEFDGVAFAASVLNELPPDDLEELLNNIEESHAELAPKIREAMFTFEDLCRLDARSLQSLMREVPSDQLLLALKTASEALREKFLSAVSSRAAQTILEDLENMPPTRLSDVENAQRSIVELALRLASENRIVLPGGGGEEMV